MAIADDINYGVQPFGVSVLFSNIEWDTSLRESSIVQRFCIAKELLSILLPH